MSKSTKQVVEVEMPDATDTGEPGYHEMSSALAIVSSFDAHERPVMITAHDHAEYRLKASVANGKRETYSRRQLEDLADRTSMEFANLVFGRWNKTATLKRVGVNESGWHVLHENGERSVTDRHVVAFVELPENSVLASRVGPYACIRIRPEVVVNGRTVASLQLNNAGYLETSAGDDRLVEGVLYGYSSFREAMEDLTRLTDALRTLYFDAQARNANTDPARESELLEAEEHDRKVAALAAEPWFEDGL